MTMLVLDSSRDHWTCLIKILLWGAKGAVGSREQYGLWINMLSFPGSLGRSYVSYSKAGTAWKSTEHHPLGSPGAVWPMPMMLLSPTSFMYFFFWPSIIQHGYLQLDPLLYSLELSFKDCWKNPNYSQKSKRYSHWEYSAGCTFASTHSF